MSDIHTIHGLSAMGIEKWLNQHYCTAQPSGMLSTTKGVVSRWIYQSSKRTIDICGALVGLLALGFVLPIIACCIYGEDRGPIFYSQKRIGLNGESFRVFKFRSMVANADTILQQNTELAEKWQRNGKLPQDPRVTRVGRFLRRTSLDELPQMLNILSGEMSLVGPRAIQSRELASIGELAALRQLVKPGLTGLWQISGRSRTTYEQRTLLDCMYVIESSFGTDLRILINTCMEVVRGEGAY